jgi:NAD(P)-dependent dehydrogenase (short-subunit alcohol dehydrogenase family)
MPHEVNAIKSVLITGCSSGIGYATAVGLKEAGYQVFATARSQSDVERLQNEGFLSTTLDLDSSESITNAVQYVLDKSGGELYALFNNGAYGQPGALEDLSTDALKAQFETNVFGWHELINQVLPIMRKQGYGRIIQNSSVLGLISLKYRGAYNASKYAIEGLSDTLRLELMGSNIHMVLIEPGPVTSSFRKNAYSAFKNNINYQEGPNSEAYAKMIERFEGHTGKDPFELPASDVMKKVLKALESKNPKAHYYVTVPTYIFGYLKRLLPTWLLDKILVRV